MKLRVLSYNIHRAIGVDRRFRPERIVEIIESHDPDIALLQEVDEGVPRSRELNLGRELAQALGYEHYAIGLPRDNHSPAVRGQGRVGLEAEAIGKLDTTRTPLDPIQGWPQP